MGGEFGLAMAIGVSLRRAAAAWTTGMEGPPGGTLETPLPNSITILLGADVSARYRAWLARDLAGPSGLKILKS